jgi:hypothetical protein
MIHENFSWFMKNKIALLVTILVLIVPSIAVQAETDGYRLGFSKGSSDQENSLPYNDKCDIVNNTNFCTEYKSGYRDGYNLCPTSVFDNSCQLQDKKCNVYHQYPGLRDLLYRLECEMPFLYDRNNTNSTSP